MKYTGTVMTKSLRPTTKNYKKVLRLKIKTKTNFQYRNIALPQEKKKKQKSRTVDKHKPRNNIGGKMSEKDVSKDDVYLLVWFCVLRQGFHFGWTHQVAESDPKLTMTMSTS